MSKIWFTLMATCGLAALVFNASNAYDLWGFVGAFFSVVTFPIMWIVVPIVLLTKGIIPVYWLLIPAMGLFFYLGHRASENDERYGS